MKSHGPGMDYAADETGLHGRDFTLMDFNRLPIPFKFTLSRDAVLPRKIGIRKDLYAIGDLIRYVGRSINCHPEGLHAARLHQSLYTQ